MNSVITIRAEGQPNVMAFLFVKDEQTMDGVMYVVENATCYAHAVQLIAEKEGITQRQADDIIYRQNCKKFKHKFLKAQGYKMLSALNVDGLNAILSRHFNLAEGDL